ncbi:MAG: type IV secretory system conjugative DNA transfer family protein [Clostridia bacterium]|nr:type IV secretory system conjugative DNA transfer family protein [Clostridia bacterium]
MSKKWIQCLIFTIINIPLSIYISAIVHLKMTNQSLNLNIEIIRTIIKDNQYQRLLMLCLLLTEVIIIVLLYSNSRTAYKTDTVRITNKIKTPIIAGEGQHGTSRWLTKKEFANEFKCNVLDKKKDNKCKSGGIVVGFEKKIGKENVYYIDNNIHTLTVGATRSGKTRSVVLESIGNLGLAGESMIISDPKAELCQYTSRYLESLGYKIITIDFKNPTKSTRYNFLQPVIDAVNREDYRKAEEYSWDITESLVGDDSSKMEKIWRDGEMAVIAGAIMSVVFDNKENPEYQNLTNVFLFISEMCRPIGNNQMPINKYIEDLPPSHPASIIFSIARIAPEKTRGSFFTSALATLKLFTSKSIYGMSCESEFRLQDAGNEKIATYIILPDEKTTYYPLASLFVYQNYTALVEEADQRGGELKNRVNYVLDEFGNFTTIPAFSNMLTVAGGRKIRFNIFLQSFAQLENKYGREIAENIRDNCQIWLYLKTASFETASVISKKLGQYTTTSYSKSNSYSKYSNSNNSESMNLIGRALLTEDEVMRVERPYILVIPTGMYPIITKLPDISHWEMNKKFGMGNEKHNVELRQFRERARTSREIKEMKIWEVWKYYR